MNWIPTFKMNFQSFPFTNRTWFIKFSALYLQSWSKHIFLVQSVLFQVFYKHLLWEFTGVIWNHIQGFHPMSQLVLKGNRICLSLFPRHKSNSNLSQNFLKITDRFISRQLLALNTRQGKEKRGKAQFHHLNMKITGLHNIWTFNPLADKDNPQGLSTIYPYMIIPKCIFPVLTWDPTVHPDACWKCSLEFIHSHQYLLNTYYYQV